MNQTFLLHGRFDSDRLWSISSFVLGCTLSMLLVTGCGSTATTTSKQVSNKVSLGEVKKGGSLNGTCRLAVDFVHEVEVLRFESSCPCFKITIGKFIPTNGHIDVHYVLDLSAEPDFEGSLAISYDFIGKDGKVILQALFQVDIK